MSVRQKVATKPRWQLELERERAQKVRSQNQKKILHLILNLQVLNILCQRKKHLQTQVTLHRLHHLQVPKPLSARSTKSKTTRKRQA